MTRELVIDDDVDIAETMEEILMACDFDVTLAHHGETAIDLVKDLDFDAIILDMKMPEMNGVECLEGIRRQSPEVQVLILTAFTHDEFVRQALASGAVVMMPIPQTELEIQMRLNNISRHSPITVVTENDLLGNQIKSLVEALEFKARVIPIYAGQPPVNSTGAPEVLIWDSRSIESTRAKLMIRQADMMHFDRSIFISLGPPGTDVPQPCIFIDDVLTKPLEVNEFIRRTSAAAEG